MKRNYLFKMTTVLCIFLLSSSIFAITPDEEVAKDSSRINEDKLVVVWTSGDKEVAMKMVFMYTYNAMKYEWWDDITLLVWGPSSKLLSEDTDLQDYVTKMLDEGIEVLACKACADLYEVSEKLEQLGITVRYTGKDLTSFIKERHVITF